MQSPVLCEAQNVLPDTTVLPGFMPVPGMGVLAVNAFVIRAGEPVLVDTGLGALRETFLAQLERVVDLDDLRWIWLTHTDPDHVGALRAVLERAPKAKVVTTYLGMGKLGMFEPVAPERVYLLNPGQSLWVGDRSITAIAPPTFDAPETTGALDTRSGALFSADSFGAVLREPREAAADIPSDELCDGMLTWATVDAPWLHSIEAERLDGALGALRRLEPRVVLSAHPPPATRMTETLLGHLRAARTAPPFVGPDQQALMQMMAAAG